MDFVIENLCERHHAWEEPLRRRHRQHDAVQVRTTLVAATLPIGVTS